MRVLPGKPTPLGAHWDGEGVNFALFSEHATAVELCLFDDAGRRRETRARAAARARPGVVWHGYLPDAAPGPAATAIACTARTRPTHGHRFNPAQAAVDPYARAISGPVRFGTIALRLRRPAIPTTTRRRARATAPPLAPKSIVVESAFAWGDDRPPRIAVEPHGDLRVPRQGLTARHPDVPGDAARHVSRARAPTPSSSTCSALGVTAVELLPVHHAVVERAPRRSAASPTTGATTRSASSRRTRASRAGRRGEPGRRVQDDGASACTAPASR